MKAQRTFVITAKADKLSNCIIEISSLHIIPRSFIKDDNIYGAIMNKKYSECNEIHIDNEPYSIPNKFI